MESRDFQPGCTLWSPGGALKRRCQRLTPKVLFNLPEVRPGHWGFKSAPGDSNEQPGLRIRDLVQFSIFQPGQHLLFPSGNNLKATLHTL